MSGDTSRGVAQPSPVHCVTADCQYFGTSEHRGLCSNCFAALHSGEQLQEFLDESPTGKWGLAAVAREEQERLRWEDTKLENGSVRPLSAVTCVLALRNRAELRPIRARVAAGATLKTLFRAVTGQALARSEEEEATTRACLTDSQLFGYSDRVRVPAPPWNFTDMELRDRFYSNDPTVDVVLELDVNPESKRQRQNLRFRRVAFRRNGTKRPDNAFSVMQYSENLAALTIEKLKRSIYLEQQESSSFAALESANIAGNILLSLRWWDDIHQRSTSLGDLVVRSGMTIAELKEGISLAVELSPSQLVIVEQETPEVFNVARDDAASLESLELIHGDVLVVEKLDPSFHMNSKGLQIHRERVCYACHAGPPIIGDLWRCTMCTETKLLCGRCNDLKRHADHILVRLEAPASGVEDEHKAIRTKTGEHYARVRRKKMIGQAESARVALLRADPPAWHQLWHYRFPRTLRDQITCLVRLVTCGRQGSPIHHLGQDLLFSIIRELVTISLTRFAGISEANRCTRVVHHVDTSLNDHNDDTVASLILNRRAMSFPPTCRPVLCVWQRGKAPARTPALGLCVDAEHLFCAFPDNGTNAITLVSLRNGRTLLKVPGLHNRRRGCALLPKTDASFAPRLVVLSDHVMSLYEITPEMLAAGHELTYTNDVLDDMDDNNNEGKGDQQGSTNLFEEDKLKDREYDEKYFAKNTSVPLDSDGNHPISSLNVRDLFHQALCPLEELSEKCILAFHDKRIAGGIDRIFIANCPRNRRDDCVMEFRPGSSEDRAHLDGWELYHCYGKGLLTCPTALAVDSARRRLIVGQATEAAMVFELDSPCDILSDLTLDVIDAQHIAVDPISGHVIAAFANASALAVYPIQGPGIPSIAVSRVLMTGDDTLERPVGVAFCPPREDFVSGDPRLYVLDAEFEGLRIVTL